MSEKPIVGITMGDPAGNGPEITVKALGHPDLYDRCRPIVVGDAKMLEQATRFVGREDIIIHRCAAVADAKFTPAPSMCCISSSSPMLRPSPSGRSASKAATQPFSA